MKILFVSAEIAPLAKVGGLADVTGALPKYLFNFGQDIRLVLPLYEEIIQKKYPLSLLSKNIPVQIGDDKQIINIYQTLLPQTKIPIYLIENKKYLSEGPIYSENGQFNEIKRFLFFSKSILEIPWALNWHPDIYHIQDWHTATVPLFLKLDNRYIKKPKVLFTIHNLAMQGRWNWQETMNFLKFEGNEYFSLEEPFYGPFGRDFNSMQQGVLTADFINTVSPNYAREILTKPYFSRGLQSYFQKRQNNFCGILNGIDYENFNPETDPNIFHYYSVKSLKNKKNNKIELKRKIGLKTWEDRPLFAIVSRLTFQKGIDLVLKIIPSLVSYADIVILGQGEKETENALKKIAQKYKENVKVFIEFNEPLSRQIYAASDFFLMPSKFEPCGLGQMIAMRYGSCPIVRKVGGLKDTVKPLKLKKIFFGKKLNGNGLIFTEYDSNKLWKAVQYGLSLFNKKNFWHKVICLLMKQDFSWQKSAKEYENLYKKIVKTEIYYM